ncbi:MAG: sugar phosphate isomerase/epimerase family protein [Nitrososphaerota archaeon]
MEVKYGVGLWLFGALNDRFAMYRPPRKLEEKIFAASQVKGAQGVEVVYPAEFGFNELDKFKSLLKEHKLEVAGLIVDLFTQLKWVKGSLTSRDDKLRKEAIELSIQTVDVAKELGCEIVTLWLGHDGYDYVFQANYTKGWDDLVQGLREIAAHNSNIKIGIEYKPKEPRTHSFISTVGKAILLANEVGLSNVGVTLDVGHALYSGENPAESLALLHRYKRLSHIHLNDNYRDWDHDLIPGTVNILDTLEFLYWLRKMNYKGWISLDIYPNREDVVKACELSIENIQLLFKMLHKIGEDYLEKCIEQGEAVDVAAILRRAFE